MMGAPERFREQRDMQQRDTQQGQETVTTTRNSWHTLLRKSAAMLAMAALLLLTHGSPGITPTAEASVLDNLFFKVLGLTLVWGADSGGTAPIVSDFVLMTSASGTAGDDITPDDVHTVITGTLDPVPVSAAADEGFPIDVINQTSGGVFTDDGDGVLDPGDTLTAFGIDITTDLETDSTSLQRSFYVASNTAFDINASATISSNTLSSTLADVAFSCDGVTLSGTDGTITYGGNSQDPSTGGSGFTCPANLGALGGGGSIIFDGGQATAASVGTIATQSVRFDFTYNFVYDLAMGVGEFDVDVIYTVFVP